MVQPTPTPQSHHTKTDSEATTITLSPTRSPRRPTYYVQSPSRDSHDGHATATSFHSTPADSPPHSHSSSTRYSASLKNKVLPEARVGKETKRDCEVIEEEGLLEEEGRRRGVRRRCYFVGFVGAFFLLFGFFALVLWGASRNQRPTLAVKSIKFENFIIQAGTDATGVPTDMVSLNSTVKLTFRNTATFFGLHVSSTPIQLFYTELSLASGNIENFYQSRKSQRTLVVVVEGNRIPLYGGGSGISISPAGATTGVKQTVPLTISFKVRSRAYVLGKLVNPKFYIDVLCTVAFDSSKLNKDISLKNCTT